MEWAPQTAPVLIAEDDLKTGTLVATYPEREGFRRQLAGEGKQALALARHEAPLFVILDLMLPGADGWEVCQALRRDSDVPRGRCHCEPRDPDVVFPPEVTSIFTKLLPSPHPTVTGLR